ncbi:putative bifunctional UDP-N-acetylglucosamine transferase and deubiquitinase ALG13 isoform X9 [Myripristis murdjan]|uniref:putative bifunctional UDP-N-acetylglucosamine transferase and deubiquitinase ALG13 isoform X9 n=1 Tax=Myripristis murdjan TaxID=586833 RepID=UPI001175E733|nr:putative bifunctional UDP-N-acetylglucosamine transferase and deubiquitinase ALG13 isoform X9 [Myripristis murdjan]
MQKRPKKCFATMDEYLASRALYRKTMARDASSLFRAVSEQLYHSQSYHQKIRQDCANFIRANRCKFEPFVEGSFDKYLERLEDPKETVGQLEIKALSLLYRLRFVIYLYPGQPPKVITEDGFTDKVILCCSNSGHYDIVYHRSFLTSAAICQSILYELLYTRVFGVDEAELHQAMDAFQDRRYRNRLSAISHGDMSYELPEDRSHKEEAEAGGAGAAAEDKARAGTDDSKPPAEPSSSTLILPYKVLKSLDTILYRNVEFDVWLDSCKDGLETDYMVFAARQYFVGDQCQVRLEPKGKYYKALIEDVGTLAVTVFIEELGEKHFVPLTNVKPVNPVNTVPARNIPALSWKGDLDSESRGQRRHRRRYFRKAQGGGGLLPLPSSYVQAALPPLFQPAGHTQPPPPSSAGAMTYDPSSTHFLNQHLIGPQLAFYDPVRQYYHIYDNYAFCSRCSQRQLAAALNKDCQFGFSAETGEEEPADLEGNITYDQLDDANEAVFPPLPGQAVAPPPKLGVPPPSPPPPPAYWVQRGPGPLPPTPPPRKPPVTSSEEDQEDASTVEDQNPGFQSPVVSTAAEPVTSLAVEEGGAAESPTDGQQKMEVQHSYCADNCSAKKRWSSRQPSSALVPPLPPSHPPPPHLTLLWPHTSQCQHTTSHAQLPWRCQPRLPGWLMSWASLCAPWWLRPLTPTTPTAATYPEKRDYMEFAARQYFLGDKCQWCHQNCWQLAYAPPSPEAPYTYQAYPHYHAPPTQDASLHDPGFQSPVVSTAAEPVTSLAVEEGGAAESPTDGQKGQAVAPPPKLGAPPPPPPASSYWVQRGPGPLPPTSTVEDQTDYSEFYIYKAQDPGFQSPVVSTAAEPVTSLAVEEGGAAESPTDGQKGQAVAPPPKLGAPPPPPPASSYWVQRGPGPLPPTSTVEDQNPGFQSPVVSTAAEPVTSLAVEEGGAAESPTDGQKGQAVAPPPKLGAPPPPPPASSYWVQRGPGPLPPTSTVEDQNPGFQSPVVSTAAEPVTSLAVEEGGAAESPTDGQQGQAVAPPPKLGAPPPPPPASSYWVQRGPGPLPPTSTVEDQNPGFQSPVVSTAAEPVTSLGQAVAPPPKLGAPPPPPPASSYWVQRGPGPLPPTSTVEDQTDYSEFYIYKAQDPGFQSPVVSTAAEPVTSLAVEEGGAAESPTDGQKKMEVQHSYCADNCSAKKRWSSRQPSSAFVPPLPPSHPPPPHLTLLWPHTSQCQHTASHAQLPWRCQPRLPGWLMSWASLCAPWWLRPLTPTTPTAATYPESCRRETTWSLQPGSTSWETSVSGATRAAGSWPTHPPHLRRPTPTRPTPTTTPPPPRMHRSTAPPSPWKSPPPPPPSSVVCLQAPPPRHSSTRSSPSPLPPLSCTSHMKPRLHSTSLPPLLFLLLTPTSPITPPTTLTSPLPPSPLRSHQEALTTGPTHGSTSPPLTPPTWLVTSQPRPLTTQPLTTFHRACDPASMCRNMLTLLFSCQPIREGAGLCRRGLILCLFMENISVQYSNG